MHYCTLILQLSIAVSKRLSIIICLQDRRYLHNKIIKTKKANKIKNNKRNVTMPFLTKLEYTKAYLLRCAKLCYFNFKDTLHFICPFFDIGSHITLHTFDFQLYFCAKSQSTRSMRIRQFWFLVYF